MTSVSYPEDVRYTREHEWARDESGIVTVGITSYATDQLGDVVFVELPKVGKRLEAGKPFGVVEAVKTVSDLYAPLTDNPALVNQEPFGDGWMIRIRPVRNEDVKQLLDHREYAQHVEEQHA